MENKGNSSKWPARLSEIFEQFEGTPESLLENSLKELNKIFESQQQRHKLAIESFLNEVAKTQTENKDREEKATSAIGTYLNAVNPYLKGINELPVERTITQINDEIRKKCLQASLGESVFSKDLDLNFWKSADTDSFPLEAWRIFSYHKYRVKGVILRKGKASRGYYGTQQFQLDLFFQFFYVLPVSEKLYSLITEFLLLHAKNFHELHLADEAFVKEVVAAEKSNIDEPDALTPKLKAIIEKYLSRQSDNNLSSGNFTEINHKLQEDLSDFEARQEEKMDILVKRAGTDFLHISRFTKERIENHFQQLVQEVTERAKQWNAFFNAEKVDWIKDIELMNFNHLSLEIFFKAKHQLIDRVTRTVLPALEEAADEIQASRKLFSRQHKESDEGLKENILKESRSGLRKLRREKIPHATDLLNDAAVPKIFNNVISQLKYRVSNFDDEYLILQQANLERIPPKIKLQDISLKKIIEIEYLSVFSKNFQEISSEAEEFLGLQFRTLNEIGQIIEFNIETALEIIETTDSENEKPDAQVIISDGLERAAEILADITKSLTKEPLQWSQRMKELFLQLNSGINELLDNQKMSNLQLREARAEASTKFEKLRADFMKTFGIFAKKSWYWLSYGMTGAKSGYKQFSRLTGAGSLPELEKELMDLLFTTRSRIEKLPFVYQRLYRFEPLTDYALFAGREKEIASIEEKYQHWKSGNFANTAIIGEKGSGRTTLLQLASKTKGLANPLVQINFHKNIDTQTDLLNLLSDTFKLEGITTYEVLRDGINDLKTPVVCMIEDMHFLFLRTLDGLDIIERLLWLISQTQHKVFWIISIGSYCWNFLDATISISRYFHHMIYLSKLEVNQIREIILKRHRISGYGLEFLPDEEAQHDRRYRNLRTYKEQQEYLDREFFKELHAMTTGNISVGFMLWQLSIEEFKKDKVIMRSNLKLNTNFLNNLPEEELFTLEAFLEHEIITIKEYSLVFNETEEKSSQILNRMKNKGLLVETLRGFQIHYLLYKPIVKTMNLTNMIK